MADLSQIPTDQLVQMLASHPALAAAPQAAPKSIGQGLSEELGGVAHGLYSLPQSAIELGLQGTDALGLTNNRAPQVKQFFDQANNDFTPGLAEGSPLTTGGTIAGQVLGTAPLMAAKFAQALPYLSKLPTLARIADGALQGGAAGALTSSSNNAPLSDQIALGMAGGAALPAAGAALRAGGKAVTGALGLSTGAGGASIRNAFQAGVAGGDRGRAFTDSMRGNTSWDQVVNDAKTAIGNMRATRNQAYRSGMADISKDATVLDFAPIDKAMADATAVKTFKGLDLSPKTADVRKEIAGTIDTWKTLDPAQFHTPEGMDALKQQLGDIKDAQPFNTPQRVVADNAYNAVRKTIADQAPTYNKVMSGYSQASTEIDALQKELSLGKKGNPNTALRKLQSVMRDNANTSWGKRAGYADTLAANGAPNLLPSLAGQALSTAIPRGLTKYADMAGVMGGGAANLPATLAALPLASPRFVGEAAYGLGAAQRGIGNALNYAGAGALSGVNAPNFNPMDGILAARLAQQQGR